MPGRLVSLLGPALVPLFLVGCGAEVLAVEVLPARVGATCAASSARDNAAGRGVLDLEASATAHGAYLADIRLSARSDVRVDGLSFSFTLPEEASVDGAADDAAGVRTFGNVFLSGSDDDLRTAVVENVVLLPRSLAVALRTDNGLGAGVAEYRPVGITMTPALDGEVLPGASFQFTVDVCKGCLISTPAAEDCPQGVSPRPVCRFGQDVPHLACGN